MTAVPPAHIETIAADNLPPLAIRQVWVSGEVSHPVATNAEIDVASTKPKGPMRRAVGAFAGNLSAMAGLIVLCIICLMSIAAPWISPEDPLSLVARPLLWPGQNMQWPLGSDSLGRDVAAQLLHGSRVSLVVGVTATFIGVAVGVLVGATAGYFGGRIDDFLVRIVEIFQTLPGFVLLVVVVAVLQPSIVTVTVAIGLTTWPTVARLTRSEFRSLRERDFVMAARSLGFGPARIIFLEILPNALPPIIVTASMMIASAILQEATLSFMGLGDPGAVSWGSMIGDGREFLRSAWYLTALPGLAIFLTVLAINLVGDGLNDALNPKLSNER